MKSILLSQRGRNLITLVVLAVASLGILTSCYRDSESWWSEPPFGWQPVKDPRLSGYWQLVQYNSDPVSPYETNYLYFNGNGNGYYYYFDNGYRTSELIRYWCINPGSGSTHLQLNIQYQYHSALTTSYWFTHGGNKLWMEWTTDGGSVQTYVYDRINRAPW